MRVSRRRFAGSRLLVAALLAGLAQPARAAAGIPLDIIIFSGVQDLPFFVATEKGFFEEQGLDVRITLTGSSTELREGMAAGKYQIAHTAADNAVAMVELQHADTVIIMGGDNSFNHLFVTPEIKTYEDLRGKTLVVDAPNTAFALVAYQMLADHGVKRGEYTVSLEGGTPAKRIASMADNRIAQAGMLNLPYSVLAPGKGLHELGSLTSAIGQYQGTTGFVLRPWAGANRGPARRGRPPQTSSRRRCGARSWPLRPTLGRQRHGYLCRRPRGVNGEARLEKCDSRRPLDRRGRSGALHWPSWH